MKRAAIFVGCGSFFFVYRSSETRSQTAYFRSPLTAKLTAKPVDNRRFPWMGVEIRLACRAVGRHLRLYSIPCRKRRLLSTKSETRNKRFCGLFPHKIAASSKWRHKLAASCRWLWYDRSCFLALFLERTCQVANTGIIEEYSIVIEREPQQ
jgi:hypothetical protein